MNGSNRKTGINGRETGNFGVDSVDRLDTDLRRLGKLEIWGKVLSFGHNA